jgi:tetratricopeptide (TPR) repeat protein
VRYARTGRGRWYGAALLLALLATLAKPVAVVVPALLLLVDLWPLERLRGEAGEGDAPGPRRRFALLAAEKVPFLVLSAAASLRVVSYLEGRDSVREGIGLAERAGHALAAPFLYLGQSAWPAYLPFRYFRTPWEGHAGALAWALPAAAAVTAAALLIARRRPYLAFGWGWYLAALLPTGALLPAGVQWLSDRFTLLPHAGLAVAAAWLASDATPRRLRRALPAAALALAALLALLSHRQLSLWRDPAALLEAGLPANDDDPAYLAALAGVLTDGGRTERAREVVERLEAAARGPGERDTAGVRRIALVAAADGREEAIRAARGMLDRTPGAAVQLKLAELLLLEGRYGEAEREFREAPERWPLPPRQRALALEGRGLALAALGREEEARPLFEEGLRVFPSGLTLQGNLDLLRGGGAPRHGAGGSGAGGTR